LYEKQNGFQNRYVGGKQARHLKSAMKKILSILMLTAGLNVAASAATTLLEQSIVGYSDFESRIADFGTQRDSVTIATSGDNLLLSGPDVKFSQPSGNGGRNNMTLSMVLDLSKLNTPESYTALFNAKGGSTSWGVGLNTDRTLQGLWNNGAYSGGPTTTTLGTEGTLTISVVTGESGTRIYLGDESTYYTASGLKFGNVDITQLLINAGMADAIEQLYVHDSALSQEQIGQLMAEIANVPEPATASLSLLGLAALMMRRRRA
jgi:hypothetical protein